MNWDNHDERIEHDGTLVRNCSTCDQIRQFPCQWCGYGGVFYSHNLLAHTENGDPICQGKDGFGENNFQDQMLVAPWRDWWEYIYGLPLTR